jgi:Cellulose biosynthesis protein BcsS
MSKLMRAIGLAGILLANVAAAASAGGKVAPGTKSVVWYSGVEVTENAWFSYSGGLVSAKGNLALPGITFNGAIGGGKYDYDTLSVAGGNVDVDYLTGHLLVGYTGIIDKIWLGVYGGVDFQSHDLKPFDFTNSVNGDETGAKVVGELITVGTKDLYFDAYGAYSTAFDTYFTRLQIGPIIGNVKFGPEGALLGDEEWNGKRIGGFVKFPLNLGPGLESGTLSFSAGHQSSDDARDSAEGAYGTVQIKFLH